MTGTDREQAIALLEATHTFPCEYAVSVIAKNAEEVTAELLRAVEELMGAPLDASAREVVPSRGGRYLSHRLRVPCRTADDVLQLFARIRTVQGVVTVL